MLSAILKDKYGKTVEVGWHCGTKTPDLNHKDDQHAIDVMADGDELIYISQQFDNIPITNRKIVRWTGETAQFIMLNL